MNKRIAWLTDIHLDHFVNNKYNTIKDFCEKVLEENPEGIIITGDITNSRKIVEHFGELTKYWTDVPVYFVLGNHDYYGGSFNGTRRALRETIKNSKNFFYLSDQAYVQLTDNTVIAGHDGWYDGGYADWFAPGVVVMQDYFLIEDFLPAFFDKMKTRYVPHDVFEILQTKALECAGHIKSILPKAFENNERVIYATHVPPFEDACVYNKKKSDPFWMPNFSSKKAGDAFFQVMKEENLKEKQLIVLCGHTHGEGSCKPTDNILCHTGNSKYGDPLSSFKILEI